MVSLTGESTVLSGVGVKRCVQRTCMIGLVLILALPVGSSAQTAELNVNSLSTLPPQSQLVSINRFGTDSGNNDSGGANQNSFAISADGRFVAFESRASDLVANDTNGIGSDVFVRDLQTGMTTLVSVNRFGTSSDRTFSTDPSISADGRFVAFTSGATDLVANDTTMGNVFVRDVQSETTVLVSVNRAGTNGGNDRSGFNPVRISADGRFVLFASLATDLVATDTNGKESLFVRDLHGETTTLVTSAMFQSATLSADGRFVAFDSTESTLGGGWNVFERDLQRETTTLVSVNRFGTDKGNGNYSVFPVLSADGRFVAFQSDASDLVAIDDTNGGPNSNGDDIFVRDMQTGITTLASVNRFGTNSGGGPVNPSSEGPVLSPDGRFVAFTSAANDLVENDNNGAPDVFLRDLHTATTTLVTINRDGTNSGNRGGGISGGSAAISADGRLVVFNSYSSDLAAINDTNWDPGTGGIGGRPPTGEDVFVRDLQTGTTTMVSVNRAGTNGGNQNSVNPIVSADGRFVVFESGASDLVATDTNGKTPLGARADVFVRPILTDSTPPLITPHFDGTLGLNGWYRSIVTVSWSVTDPDSGISSSSGCTDTKLTADTPKTTVTCSATNGAGLSASDTVTVKIDKTPPVITGLPAPGCTLWPPNHKLIQVGTITASDAMSGLASFDVRGSSNEASVPGEVDIVITGNGLQSRGVQLRADRSGTGIGRIYSLTAIAVDQAGNTTTSTAMCTVPHDQGKK
jgi:Tol biopolymer transport system component